MSADGIFDMVGNLHEWVADWLPRSMVLCGGSWSAGVSPTGDFQCLVGVSLTGEPGALLRGGGFFEGGPASGPLAVIGSIEPSFSSLGVGFRCAR